MTTKEPCHLEVHLLSGHEIQKSETRYGALEERDCYPKDSKQSRMSEKTE